MLSSLKKSEESVPKTPKLKEKLETPPKTPKTALQLEIMKISEEKDRKKGGIDDVKGGLLPSISDIAQ